MAVPVPGPVNPASALFAGPSLAALLCFVNSFWTLLPLSLSPFVSVYMYVYVYKHMRVQEGDGQGLFAPRAPSILIFGEQILS